MTNHRCCLHCVCVLQISVCVRLTLRPVGLVGVSIKPEGNTHVNVILGSSSILKQVIAKV